MAAGETPVFAVEKVVDSKIGKDGHRYYQVKWTDSWEPEENLEGCSSLVDAYWEGIYQREKLAVDETQDSNISNGKNKQIKKRRDKRQHDPNERDVVSELNKKKKSKNEVGDKRNDSEDSLPRRSDVGDVTYSCHHECTQGKEDSAEVKNEPADNEHGNTELFKRTAKLKASFVIRKLLEKQTAISRDEDDGGNDMSPSESEYSGGATDGEDETTSEGYAQSAEEMLSDVIDSDQEDNTASNFLQELANELMSDDQATSGKEKDISESNAYTNTVAAVENSISQVDNSVETSTGLGKVGQVKQKFSHVDLNISNANVDTIKNEESDTNNFAYIDMSINANLETITNANIGTIKLIEPGKSRSIDNGVTTCSPSRVCMQTTPTFTGRSDGVMCATSFSNSKLEATDLPVDVAYKDVLDVLQCVAVTVQCMPRDIALSNLMNIVGLTVARKIIDLYAAVSSKDFTISQLENSFQKVKCVVETINCNSTDPRSKLMKDFLLFELTKVSSNSQWLLDALAAAFHEYDLIYNGNQAIPVWSMYAKELIRTGFSQFLSLPAYQFVLQSLQAMLKLPFNNQSMVNNPVQQHMKNNGLRHSYAPSAEHLTNQSLPNVPRVRPVEQFLRPPFNVPMVSIMRQQMPSVRHQTLNRQHIPISSFVSPVAQHNLVFCKIPVRTIQNIPMNAVSSPVITSMNGHVQSPVKTCQISNVQRHTRSELPPCLVDNIYSLNTNTVVAVPDSAPHKILHHRARYSTAPRTEAHNSRPRFASHTTVPTIANVCLAKEMERNNRNNIMNNLIPIVIDDDNACFVSPEENTVTNVMEQVVLKSKERKENLHSSHEEGDKDDKELRFIPETGVPTYVRKYIEENYQAILSAVSNKRDMLGSKLLVHKNRSVEIKLINGKSVHIRHKDLLKSKFERKTFDNIVININDEDEENVLPVSVINNNNSPRPSNSEERTTVGASVDADASLTRQNTTDTMAGSSHKLNEQVMRQVEHALDKIKERKSCMTSSETDS